MLPLDPSDDLLQDALTGCWLEGVLLTAAPKPTQRKISRPEANSKERTKLKSQPKLKEELKSHVKQQSKSRSKLRLKAKPKLECPSKRPRL